MIQEQRERIKRQQRELEEMKELKEQLTKGRAIVNQGLYQSLLMADKEVNKTKMKSMAATKITAKELMDLKHEAFKASGVGPKTRIRNIVIKTNVNDLDEIDDDDKEDHEFDQETQEFVNKLFSDELKNKLQLKQKDRQKQLEGLRRFHRIKAAERELFRISE